MKKLLLSFIVLGLLINYMPTSAEADAPRTNVATLIAKQSGVFTLPIIFGEAVDGFTQSDITLSPSSGLASVTGFSGNDGESQYDIQITPVDGQEGTLTISIAANAATATMGGEGNQAGSGTVEIDTLGSTLTITPPMGTPSGPFDVTFAFVPTVTGFAQDDIVVTNGARVTSFTGSDNDTSYTATIVPKVTGDVQISVSADKAVDNLGNGNLAASATVAVDLPHSIMVMEPDDDGPHNAAFEVMIMFTETVDSSFTTSDITLSPSSLATVTSVTGNAPTYTATITPANNKSGDVDISVEANAVQDSNGMNYPASNEVTVTVDTERPTVDSITAPTTAQNGDFDVTVEFSEDVYNFDSSDLSVSGASAPSSWDEGDDGDDEYTGTIDTSSISSGSTGTVTISVGSNAAEDEAGNGNFASASSVDKTVTVDKKKPTPTIGSVSGTKNAAFMISITFDESVTDFAASDISLSKQSGTAGGTASRVTGSGTTYSATITPTGMGTLRISISAGAAEDGAGNTSRASANVDVSVDTEGPTVTISAPTTDQNGAFDVTFTFNEAVTGFTTGDVTVTNANKPSSWKSSSTTTYTLTLTPTTADGNTGTVTIDVAADVAQDSGNNGNKAATQATVDVDKDPPTVTISAPTTDQNGAFDATFTFDQDVTGFELSDVSVTNANKASSWKSSTATEYVLTLTPTATAGQENTVTIDVAADAAMDAASNGNEAATQVSVTVDKKRPTATITGVPTTEQNGVFDLTITFSEDVTGFATGDLTVTGEASATAVAAVGTSKTNYTATITPNDAKEGDVTVKVKANAVTDDAGNGNTVSATTGNIRIDTIAPTVSITGLPSGEENDPFNLTITFSEDVTGFATGDLTVTGQATATSVDAVNNSKQNYTATITPNDNKEGDVTVKVNADTVIDAAGNNNTASATTGNIRIDTIAPTPTITAPTTPQNGDFDVEVDFGEPVSNFVVGDLTVTGATKTSSWKSSTARKYTMTLTPTTADGSTGTVTIDVNASVAQDNAANNNTAATQATVDIDKDPPTVTISAPTTDQNGAFDATFTFDQDVTGFELSDVSVTNANKASSWKSSTATEYVLTLTPTIADGATGTVTIDVAADAAMDAASNGNEAATQASVAVDKERPTVTITNIPTTEQKNAFDLTITFSEDVTEFAKDDLTVTGEASATAVSGSGSSYTATITPNAAKEGDVTVKVNENAVTDEAGNNNTASAVTGNIHIDTIAPTATITGAPTTEQNSAFNLTITFNETVTGFAKEDLTVTGEATATAVSGSGSSYTATITPNATEEGDVTVKVNENAVTDDAGNANPISAATGNIHIDTIVPTVEISDAPTIEKNVAYDLTITFSEAVNGFAVPGDLTITGPGTAALKSGADGASVYTVTITPNATSEGEVAVTVNASTVQDMATNANSAGSNTATVHVDTIVPTVSVSGFPTIEKNVAYDLTVTFSEEVNGFEVPADLTLGLTTEAGATPIAAATLKSGAAGAAEYVVTITPNAAGAEGDVTVTVNASAVQDLALNNNTASTETDVVHVDTIIPEVSVSGFPTTEQNAPYDLTVTFTEPVNGFAAGDVAVSGPASATLTSGSTGAAVYTVTITPNPTDEGDVTVTVNANTVQDFALNDNTAGSPETNVVHVDTIPPTVSMVVTPPVEIGGETGYPTEERNEPYTLTVTFSEAVNDFAVPGDLTVTGPGTAALTDGVDGDIVYTVTITPDAAAEGDVTVAVNTNAIQDFATNPNPAGSNPVEVHIDTIPPTFTIEDTPVLQKRNDFFDIRIVFSEEVNDFRLADLTPSDLVTPSLQAGADGASEYIVRMTPNEDVQGDLFIEVNAETVQDFALNLNADSVATTQPVRIDTIAPTVEITDLPTGAKSEPFDITITFAETVNGFTTEDIALVGPATVLLTSGTDGDAIYTARVTPNPNANGTVTLQVPAAVVEDLARNPNLPSLLTDSIVINTNALTVELQDVPEAVQLDAFSVIIAFSNDVEGFVLGDIEITGDAVVLSATLLGTGRAYTLTVTPDENTDGDVIITVPADVVQDATGKLNTASVPQTIAVAPSWMPDASLRDAFREQLGFTPGADFTQQQIRPVTAIESEMREIRDLTGLEQATALTTLNLAGNAITGIRPLRRLTKLTALNLAGNAVTDITPLAGLTELTSLNLNGNGLTSIAALEDLTSLTTVDLGNNALTDISLLENFTQLTTLNLAGNRITDISVLASLTRLTTLNLNGNPIGNFTPLTGLTALTTLELSGTGLSSLDVISGLTGLMTLNLSDNRLTDIAHLSNLTGLTALNLSDNAVNDLTTLSGLTALTILNLSDNTILDIAPLSSLTRLTTLELADNAITTLTPLTALTVLTRLDLRENGITDVSPIVGLASLETLLLMDNPILNTAPLYPLTVRTRPVAIDIAVSQYPPWDVNEDGTVDATDSALVTAALGQTGDAIENSRTDVNADRTVDNADVLLVTANFDGGVGGAPATRSLLSLLDAKTLRTLDRATLETYLNQLRLESDGSVKYRDAIALLEGLLAALRPTETRLLANYPNPFNPETWLPYELTLDSTVEIFIYNARGVLVRHLELGHQPVGYYVAKSRAAYWDGRNRVGERVSSGVYFYELRAGDVSQLRKMVILK